MSAPSLKLAPSAPAVSWNVQSKELRASVDLFKRYKKELRRLAKNPTPKTRKKSADKLEKLITGKEDLPVTKTIRATIEELRS